MSVVTHNLTYIEKGHSFAADCNIAKVICSFVSITLLCIPCVATNKVFM